MFELVWCGEGIFQKLSAIKLGEYYIESKPSWNDFYREEHYHEVVITNGRTRFRFFPDIFDHENNRFEYEFLNVEISNDLDSREAVSQTPICMFAFCNMFVEEIEYEIAGKYNHSENHDPEINLNYLQNTKFVCVAISIPILGIVISLKEYTNELTIQDLERGTDREYAFRLLSK